MEWLKRLRMDSLKKVAFRIVLFFALAVGVFVYFHCWELFGMRTAFGQEKVGRDRSRPVELCI